MSAQIIVRKSEDRGHANHGWLDSYHTFSFASYYDRRFPGYRSLAVINEDRVSREYRALNKLPSINFVYSTIINKLYYLASKGFGAHPHEDAEIFSYVVSGALAHQDSMKNKELIKRGDVQFTSAGSGIFHSEFNGSDKDWVHFIQVWIEPSRNGLKPAYTTKHFSDEEKKNKLRLIVSPNVSTSDPIGVNFDANQNCFAQSEENSIKVNQDSKVYASILEKDNKVSYKLPATRYGYLHLIQTKANSALKLNGVELKEGDGAFIERAVEDLVIESTGEGPAEFLLFDLN